MTPYTASLVRALRERLGTDSQPLPQRRLGDLVGVHWTTVARWEAGSSEPTGPALRLLRLLDARPEAATLLREWGYDSD